MDYTKVPRSLLCQDYGDIDCFLDESENSLESSFYDFLLDRPFMKDIENQAEIVLDVFNNAHYICVLILKEFHPRMYLNAYKKIACGKDPDDPKVKYIMPITLELVYCFLHHYNLPVQEDKFIDDLRSVILSSSKEVANEEIGAFMLQFKNRTFYKDSDRVSLFIPRNTSDVIRNKYVNNLDIAIGIDYIVTDIMEIFEGEDLNDELNIILKRLENAPKEETVEEAINYIKRVQEEERLLLTDGFKKDAESQPQEKRLTALQAALFCHALVDKMGCNYSNKKEQIAPLVNKLFGYGVTSIKNKLCQGYSPGDRIYVASLFEELSPDFSSFIKTFDNKHTSQEESMKID